MHNRAKVQQAMSNKAFLRYSEDSLLWKKKLSWLKTRKDVAMWERRITAYAYLVCTCEDANLWIWQKKSWQSSRYFILWIFSSEKTLLKPNLNADKGMSKKFFIFATHSKKSCGWVLPRDYIKIRCRGYASPHHTHTHPHYHSSFTLFPCKSSFFTQCFIIQA